MTSYCTVAQAKVELKAENTVQDAQIRGYIRTISERIDSEMGNPRRPFFAPYIEQRRFPITRYQIDSYDNTFLLRNPILSVSAVLKDTTNLTSQASLFYWSNEVANMLQLTQGYTWYPEEAPPNKLYVTGVWGWHADYTHAWEAVDALQANINASVTSLTVADADGADLDGFTPRFSPGNLIQIDSEWMDVNAVNITTNTLTVRRGVNGSTAAAHTSSTAISTYHVDDRIQRITARQAALMIARQGAFQVETLDGVGVITYPQDLLPELRATLTEFAYV
jgi:hypothetical protein